MMLPILISVSLAPESYFFSANEAVVINESVVVATTTATSPLGRLKGIFFSFSSSRDYNGRHRPLRHQDTRLVENAPTSQPSKRNGSHSLKFRCKLCAARGRSS